MGLAPVGIEHRLGKVDWTNTWRCSGGGCFPSPAELQGLISCSELRKDVTCFLSHSDSILVQSSATFTIKPQNNRVTIRNMASRKYAYRLHDTNKNNNYNESNGRDHQLSRFAEGANSDGEPTVFLDLRNSNWNNNNNGNEYDDR